MVLEKRITPAVDLGNSGGEGLLHNEQTRVEKEGQFGGAGADCWEDRQPAFGVGLCHHT